jgi:hypothetical protein
LGCGGNRHRDSYHSTVYETGSGFRDINRWRMQCANLLLQALRFFPLSDTDDIPVFQWF